MDTSPVATVVDVHPVMTAPFGTWHWVRTIEPPDGIWNEPVVVAAGDAEVVSPIRMVGAPALVITMSRAYANVAAVEDGTV